MKVLLVAANALFAPIDFFVITITNTFLSLAITVAAEIWIDERGHFNLTHKPPASAAFGVPSIDTLMYLLILISFCLLGRVLILNDVWLVKLI